MLPNELKSGLEQLAKQYFVGELGLATEMVPNATANLIGAFGVLHRIDERLKRAQPPQPYD